MRASVCLPHRLLIDQADMVPTGRKKQRISEDGATVVRPVSDDTPGIPGPDEADDGSGPNKTEKLLRRQLFVRSLPSTATNDTLTAHFSESYPLKHATVVTDPTTKQSKGYGFVTFTDAEDARRAQQEFNGSLFQGRKIKVETAEPRHRDLGGSADADAHKKSKETRAKRQEQEADGRQPPKLIVRNMPWSIKEPEQLAVLFRSYGKVKHATIPKKKAGLMAGFGFVVMRGRKNAEKALEAVNGKEIDGRTLAVDWAVDKDVWQGLRKPSEDADPNAASSGDGQLLGDTLAEDRSGSDTADDDVDLDMDVSDSQHLEDVDSDAGHDLDLDDDDDDDADEADQDIEYPTSNRIQDNSSTLFVRNLPFSATDQSLLGHFVQFGPARYGRVVMDHSTGRSKGTAFICFYNVSDADTCLRHAPKVQQLLSTSKKPNSSTALVKPSVLENELADPSGRYTFEGRVLNLSRAVGRYEALKLTEEGTSFRDRRDTDKRRLYLLSEGTVASNSPLYAMLAPSEMTMREASAKQRTKLIQSNPSLHLSLTRLSIRNLPRHITSKDLKALAREAVVGFAKDVKMNRREPLSKEEESRGGNEMKDAERSRKLKGKGIVKQAKVVFEGREGGKVAEGSGAGRSRGYGFVEYSSHRWALMGLRWLNGHAVAPRADSHPANGTKRVDPAERKKRLIVEFAIENAQVVARRKEREAKARERSKEVSQRRADGLLPDADKKSPSKDTLMARTRKGQKRKREDAGLSARARPEASVDSSERAKQSTGAEKASNRERIIAKKRMQRRSRKKGGSA